MAHQQLLFLEFNEINFDSVRSYVDRGLLPALGAFLERHGLSETTSERRYEELEPWIQWVTAHTGLSLAEHQVFRLGDIVDHDLPQIWERLEERGLRVGAVSPMNANCRAKQPAFFIPDPWTQTAIVAPPPYKRMYKAIAQAVNDNAKQRLTLGSILDLVAGAAMCARPGNYAHYLSYVASAKAKPWRRALFLDLLLADLFERLVATTKPDFATLFLNAGAHIQHHYLFSSAVYSGGRTNPDWYLAPGLDPVLEVYEIYDRILARVQKTFPDARLMVATGLHQDPHGNLTYYWRLLDHAPFLRANAVPFVAVTPLMSRDFLVQCRDATEALAAARRLSIAVDESGVPLFDVDNRGDTLFVMLTYPHDISDATRFSFDGEPQVLRPHVAFVAIKNGRHNGVGYFTDSGGFARPIEMPLTSIPERVMKAFAG